MNCIDCRQPICREAGLMVFTVKDCRVLCVRCAASYESRTAAFLRLWSAVPGALGASPPLRDASPTPALSNPKPSAA